MTPQLEKAVEAAQRIVLWRRPELGMDKVSFTLKDDEARDVLRAAIPYLLEPTEKARKMGKDVGITKDPAADILEAQESALLEDQP